MWNPLRDGTSHPRQGRDERGGAHGAGAGCPRREASLARGATRQDRPLCGGGSKRRRDRLPPRHLCGDRRPMAKTILCRAPGGTQGQATRGAPAPFSPRSRSPRSRRIACELPVVHGLPLSHFSRTELHRLVIERGLTEASASTIWRWLHEDAIRPWQVRSWIFRRDPEFLVKASRALDLYAASLRGQAPGARGVRDLGR